MKREELQTIRKEVSAAHKQERNAWAYAYRTDVPKLLDEIERLRGALEWVADYKEGHALVYVAEIIEHARQALEGDSE